jgi:hypothetical protein
MKSKYGRGGGETGEVGGKAGLEGEFAPADLSLHAKT